MKWRLPHWQLIIRIRIATAHWNKTVFKSQLSPSLEQQKLNTSTMLRFLSLMGLMAAATVIAAAGQPSDDECLEHLYNGVLKIFSGALTLQTMPPPPGSNDGIPCGVLQLTANALVQDYNEAGCSRGYSGGNEVFEARALKLLQDLLENPEDCSLFDGVSLNS